MRRHLLLAAILAAGCTAQAGSMSVDGGNAGASGLTLESYQIESTALTYTDEGMSEEFSGSLGAFVAVGTSAGTVDMVTMPAGATYDLTSISGSLLLQAPEGTTAQVYQALALADGEELIVSMGIPYAMGAVANNQTRVGVAFSDDATGYDQGNWEHFLIDGGDSGLTYWDGVASAVRIADDIFMPGRDLYLRFIRDGDDVVFFFCHDGRNWGAFEQFDLTAHNEDKLYIFYQNVATLTDNKLVSPLEVRWVRHLTYAGVRPF